jgi:hypothetical protein
MKPLPPLLPAFAVVGAAFGVLVALACGPSEYTTPLLEPEGTARPSSTVAQPDTLACLPEGAEIPGGPDAGAAPPCCAGLTKADVYKGSILRLDECEREADGHAFCIRCGDGKCSVGENTCSCTADCRWP